MLTFGLAVDGDELFAGGASAVSGYACSDYYAEVELGVDLADALQRVDTKSFSGDSGAFEFGDALLHELLATQTAEEQQQDSTAGGDQLRRADTAAPVEYSDNQDRESLELLLGAGRRSAQAPAQHFCTTRIIGATRATTVCTLEPIKTMTTATKTKSSRHQALTLSTSTTRSGSCVSFSRNA